MKRYIFIAFLAIAACLNIVPAAAQKFSVAYVDMQYILKNLPQYETANEQLTMISRRWQKDIETAQQEAQILATISLTISSLTLRPSSSEIAPSARSMSLDAASCAKPSVRLSIAASI